VTTRGGTGKLTVPERCGVPPDAFPRRRSEVRTRQASARLANCLTGGTLRELCKLFGVSRLGSVWNQIRRVAKQPRGTCQSTNPAAIR